MRVKFGCSEIDNEKATHKMCFFQIVDLDAQRSATITLRHKSMFLCVAFSLSIWMRRDQQRDTQVSFAEYSLFFRALLQKRPIILISRRDRQRESDTQKHIFRLSGVCVCVFVCVCSCATHRNPFSDCLLSIVWCEGEVGGWGRVPFSRI